MELEAEKAVLVAAEDLEIEEVNLGGNLSKQTTIVMCQVKFGLNTTLFFFFKFGSVRVAIIAVFVVHIAVKNSGLFYDVFKKISTPQAKLKPDPNTFFQKKLQR